MKLLIKNGTVVTPSGEIKADLLVEGNKIVKISPFIDEKCKTIDASGKHILAGIIDIHVHLREPGFEGKERYAGLLYAQHQPCLR